MGRRCGLEFPCDDRIRLMGRRGDYRRGSRSSRGSLGSLARHSASRSEKGVFAHDVVAANIRQSVVGGPMEGSYGRR